jgi:hypothetical protein
VAIYLQEVISMAEGQTFSVLRDGKILGRFSQNDLVLAAGRGRVLPTDELRDEQSGRVAVAGQTPWLSFGAGSVAGSRLKYGGVQKVAARSVRPAASHRAMPPTTRSVSMPPLVAPQSDSATQRAGAFAPPRPPQITVDQKRDGARRVIMIALLGSGAAGLFVLLVVGIAGTVMFGQLLAYDPQIAVVRDGSMREYPGKTIGEMADSFLKNPRWESIEVDGTHYVNLSGGITWNQSPAFTVLQFEIDGSNFWFRSMEINGEGQDRSIQRAMLTAMYFDSPSEPNTSFLRSGRY